MSGVSIDLKGETFGNLKVIRRVRNNHNRQPRWLCECKCGNTYIAEGRYLKSGKTKSCGCIPRGAKSATAMTSREEWDSSESRMRLQHDGADPYQSLANAIVCVAADDYRTALKDNNESLQKELEKFFHSAWYKLLTNTDPDRLLALLRREHRGTLSVAYI